MDCCEGSCKCDSVCSCTEGECKCKKKACCKKNSNATEKKGCCMTNFTCLLGVGVACLAIALFMCKIRIKV